jgi:uncharacterized repeat protein (TIGR01451 family)
MLRKVLQVVGLTTLLAAGLAAALIGFASSPARASGSVCSDASHTCTWNGNGTDAPSCQNVTAGTGILWIFTGSATPTDLVVTWSTGETDSITGWVQQGGGSWHLQTNLVGSFPPASAYVDFTGTNGVADATLTISGCNEGGPPGTTTTVTTPTPTTVPTTTAVPTTTTMPTSTTVPTTTTVPGSSVDLSVTKSGSPATQELGQGNVTWTIDVTNNGPGADTGVTIADPMPGGNTFVSATSTQGSCTGGAILNCTIGTMAAGAKVTITLVTTPGAAGPQTNTVTVTGARPETNTANNQATATVQVTAPFVPPPVFCIAVSNVTPSQLFVGRKTTLTIRLTKHGKAANGIRVRIKGPKLRLTTKRSNARGVIKQVVKMKRAGIDTFTPLAPKRCNTKRIGVTGVFTPPVTG